MMKRFVLWILSWVRAYRSLQPPACRYRPTCSEYATVAVERHGVFKGGLLAAKRILSCNPLGGRGHDPVPAVGARLMRRNS